MTNYTKNTNNHKHNPTISVANLQVQQWEKASFPRIRRGETPRRWQMKRRRRWVTGTVIQGRERNQPPPLLLQTQFVVDEVSNIIKESIESTIGGNSYVHNKVNQWTNSVVESCLASLTKLQKPFKYIGEWFDEQASGFEMRLGTVSRIITI